MYKCGFCGSDILLEEADSRTVLCKNKSGSGDDNKNWKIYICESCEEELLEDTVENAPFYIKTDRATIFENDQQQFLKEVAGALKDTINQHGPIYKETIGSATKRVWCQIWDQFRGG
jgi:hypothetical protein